MTFFSFFKTGNKKNEKGERINFRREIGELRKELKTREAAAITQILKSADVVLSTNTGQLCSRVKKMSLNCSSNDERQSDSTCLGLQVRVMMGL